MLPPLWPDRRRGGHQYAIDLPGYIALEAADDLSLALALCSASGDVLFGAPVSAHPNHADHVQRSVGVPVATAVEAMPDNLARGSLDRRDTAEAGEGGLALQPLGIVSDYGQQATVSSVAAWSMPMPGKETNFGAVSTTSRSSCTSSWAISSERTS